MSTKDMNNPLVSVIIPVYNGASTITRAINSVLMQTYTNLELIVINDCSTDNTWEVLNTISVTDSRIKIFQNEVNRERSITRNIGIEKASGEYLAFLDDDDQWFDTKLEKQIEYLKSKNSPLYTACTTRYEIKTSTSLVKYNNAENDNMFVDLLSNSISLGAGSTLLMSKETILELGCFDTKFNRNEDIDLMLKYLNKYKLAIVPEILVTVFGHNSTRDTAQLILAKETFLERYSKEIDQLGKKKANTIYAKQWLQVSRYFSLDGDIRNTIKYLIRSLKYTMLNSDKVKILPKETYFMIPIYLLKSIIFNKKSI